MGAYYSDYHAAREMVIHMAGVIQQGIIEDIRESPVWALVVDESTDRSDTQHCIVYIRYICKGETKVKCLDLLALKDGEGNVGASAPTILKAVTTWAAKHKLDTRKMMCLGSDGASVMLGNKAGLATLLKQQLNPYLLAIHCTAHRLNLALGDSCDNEDVKRFEKTCHGIYCYFSMSPKRQGTLGETHEVIETVQKKIHTLKITRSAVDITD